MDYLNGLNEAQRTAVTASSGPILVLAGPGSGKTRVLTHRIVYLIREMKVSPWHILAVTFTNKAAKEMRHRVEEMMDGRLRGLMMGTFHSTCARILRRETDNLTYYDKDFVIFDTADQQQVVKQALKDLNLDDKKFPPNKMLNGISNAKNELLTPELYNATNYIAEVTRRVYVRYQEILHANNAMDFDDLLMNVVLLFEERPDILEKYQQQYHHILVDEFQDTNTAQYALLKRLAAGHNNIFVVGDSDQCFPEGTLIETPLGQRPIETIQEGDEIIAASGRGQSMTAVVKYKGSRYYQGDLIRIQTRHGYTFSSTPNHIVFAQLGTNPDSHYVYLMYRADLGYRIGVVVGARSNGTELITGLMVRSNQENADRIWILRVCEHRDEAYYWEMFYAFQYGIPTTVFHVRGRRMQMSQEAINHIFANIDTKERAECLLSDLGMNIDYPHFIPRARLLRHAVHLRLFGDQRRSLQSPWNAHRVSVWSNSDDLKDKLERQGHRVRKGRRQTWRTEYMRLHYDDIQTIAKELSEAGDGLEIVSGAFLTQSNDSLLARRFSFMPASHLHPSMFVAVILDDQIIEDEIVSVTNETYSGSVYDLEVKELHNYLAGGIVVHNSIYKWRGADYRNINHFRENYPEAQQILLEQNYRSTQLILDAAKAIIRHNSNRVDKDLFTERRGGERIVLREAYNDIEEAETIVSTIQSLLLDGRSPSDFAVMYRTNAQSRSIEEAFVRAGMPYRLVGATQFYKRREVKDLIAYLRLVHNPLDSVSYGRILNVPPRGIGAKSKEQLEAWATSQNWSPAEALIALATDPDVQHPFNGRALAALSKFGSLLDAWITLREQVSVGELMDLILEQTAYREYIDDGTEEGRERWENVMELRNVAAVDLAVSLSEFLEQVALVADADNVDETVNAATLLTLHAAKGLEFPVVFITGLEDGILPHSRSFDDGESMAEERRLFYVGITRAEDQLYLSHAFRRAVWGEPDVCVPSRFLNDLPLELIDGGRPGQRRQQAKSRASSWSWSDNTPRSAPQPKANTMPTPRQNMPTPNYLKQDTAVSSHPTPTPAQFKTGQKVRHVKFGEGTVIESKLLGSDEEVTVAFPGTGIKRLAASFAKLEKIED